MREVRGSQIAVPALLLILFLLTMFIVPILNNFGLPTASNIFPLHTSREHSSNADGILNIFVKSNLTVFPSSQSSGSIKVGDHGFVNEPVQGVAVSITNLQTQSRTIKTTDSDGQLVVSLSAAEYVVGFLDWRLNYSTLTVEIHSGQSTDLRSYLNATSYPVQSFNVIDTDSSGWVVGWQQMYMLVPATWPVSGLSTNTFMETGTSTPFTILASENPENLTQVSIIGRFQGQNSEWLSIQIASPVEIQSIQGLQLLSIDAKYVVSS